MAENFHRQLHELKQEIMLAGSLVERSLAQAVQALATRDDGLARQVIATDDEIDRLELVIEEDCLRILALYQPVALDLRFVVAVLKINSDLERIGDLAEKIAKRAIALSRQSEIDVPGELEHMAAAAQSMVAHSLEALVQADAALAQKVRCDDDEVDALRDLLFERIREQIAVHPERTDPLMKLESVARHLERLADMASHIAEEVIYMVQGAIVRHRAGA